MEAEQNEPVIFENEFGSVTTKRVTYFRKKGWFSGGVREDVPLKHVTSVRHETSRHIIWGIVWTIFGLVSLLKVIGVLFLFFAYLCFVGSPTVIVNTAGNDKCIEKGWPWKASAAKGFVTALNGQLFKD